MSSRIQSGRGQQIISVIEATETGHRYVDINSENWKRNTRGGYRGGPHNARMKRVPVWAYDDAKIKEFVKHRFPKADEDPQQKQLASRMTRALYLYHRAGLSAPTVAETLGMSTNAVKRLMKKVGRAMTKPLGKPGRPKKGDYHQTLSGSHDEKSSPLF